MNLKSLSNDSLESRLSKLVRTERKITHFVLQCIAEIDQRKLFLDKAYPSLFEYLVREYGYSPSAAMRRIDGARLLQQLPEVAEKIESGTLNLSHVSLIQRAEREVKRETKVAIPIERKRELLSKIENQTQVHSEKVVCQTLNIQFAPANKTIQHRNESVTVTMTLSSEQMKVLEAAQAALSHAVPEKNWASLVTYLAQKELSRRTSVGTKKGTASVGTATVGDVSLILKHESEGAIIKAKHNSNSLLVEGSRNLQSRSSTPHRKPIPSAIRKKLLHPGAICSYRNPQTGNICGSRHFLQMDHIKSVSRGGGNESENLQVLCGQHNRRKFELESLGFQINGKG